MYCPVCAEPWEMDTLHEEVNKRYPDKPWYVDTKPEYIKAPDEVQDWCKYREESPDALVCGVVKDKHDDSHEFDPMIFSNSKSWNYNPWFDPKVGMWKDDKIYDDLYEPIAAEFRKTGCATFGVRHNDTKANPAYAFVYEMLGDDMDGAQAMIEDAEYLGLME